MAEKTKKILLNPKRRSAFIVTAIAVVVVIYTLLVLLLFTHFFKTYNTDIVKESAEHLADINAQIRVVIEQNLDASWKSANSISHSILNYDVSEDIEGFLEEEKEIWSVDDIYVITANGKCKSISGIVINNDVISDTVVEARDNGGKLLSIVKSTFFYMICAPDDSVATFEGSRIVAVATVRDLSTLIDEMNLSSFGGNAHLYLTEDKGSTISQLSHKDAHIVANIYSIYNTDEMECLFRQDESAGGLNTRRSTCVYRDTRSDSSLYVAVTPILVDGISEHLMAFYIVPENVVNHTMQAFSQRIITLCIVLLSTILVMLLALFLFIYLMRGKQYVKQIASREHMFDLLVSNTRNAYGLLNLNDDKPLYLSDNIAEILGGDYYTLHKEDGVYFLVSNQSHSDIVNRINIELKDWDGKSDFSSEFIPYVIDGNTYYFVFRMYLDPSDENKYIATMQDITKEREREDALRNTLVLANSANIAKTRFLANMSHDIRTPMNAIVNMTGFALESANDEDKVREYLNVIKDSSSHLLNLINDILDMSRIESGKMVIESEPFDIEQTLGDVESMIGVLAAQKHQHFEILHDVKNPKLLGDRLKVTQILMNLLNNAVKYTPEGGKIVFTATEVHSLNSEFGVFRFTIKDNGIGIEKDKLNKIFDAFVRVDDNRQVSKTEGTGLGLSICKSYVEAMGGFLTVISHVGQGSTFTAELHFSKDFGNTEVLEKPIAEQVSFTGKRVLLVEDNQINRKVASMVLSKLGFELEMANDGQLGYNAFMASEDGYFDLIYMDVQMPVMNGYEATAAIRNSEHPQAKTIPIIAMTANVFAEDIEKSRVAGMDGHIGKPIVINELIDITQKVLTNKNQ